MIYYSRTQSDQILFGYTIFPDFLTFQTLQTIEHFKL